MKRLINVSVLPQNEKVTQTTQPNEKVTHSILPASFANESFTQRIIRTTVAQRVASPPTEPSVSGASYTRSIRDGKGNQNQTNRGKHPRETEPLQRGESPDSQHRGRTPKSPEKGEHLRGTHPKQRTNPFQGGSYPEYGDRESPDKGPSPKSHDSDRETYDTEGEQWEQSPPVTPFPYGVTQDYPSLPTLEDLQQDHDIEMQSLQQYNHEQQQEHENALLQLNQMHAKALKTQKETLLRSRNVRISGELPQQHHNENKFDPIVEIQPQIGHIHSHGTTKGREHSPNTPWLHVKRGASRSPTRSHVSMDSLDAKIHDTRKVANLKHIKIEIVQLVTNSNELEWRKSVTASTAALKTPHLLEGNHRSYTHTKLKELYENLGLDLPTRYQSPSKQQPPATHKQTQPEFFFFFLRFDEVAKVLVPLIFSTRFNSRWCFLFIALWRRLNIGAPFEQSPTQPCGVIT